MYTRCKWCKARLFSLQDVLISSSVQGKSTQFMNTLQRSCLLVGEGWQEWWLLFPVYTGSAIYTQMV